MPRLERGPAGSFIVYGGDYGREGKLVQSDWDFPALAQALGWSLLQVQIDKNGKVVHLKRVHREHSKVNCRHRSTDGTIDCPGCRLTSTDFIAAASEWLSERAS